MWSNTSLPLLPGPLYVRMTSMGERDVFKSSFVIFLVISTRSLNIDIFSVQESGKRHTELRLVNMDVTVRTQNCVCAKITAIKNIPSIGTDSWRQESKLVDINLLWKLLSRANVFISILIEGKKTHQRFRDETCWSFHYSELSGKNYITHKK